MAHFLTVPRRLYTATQNQGVRYSGTFFNCAPEAIHHDTRKTKESDTVAFFIITHILYRLIIP